jgi:hypothetical protein
MLNNKIPSQRFELIRDAIGRVLTAELANQKTLAGADGIDINIFLERTCPLDKEELPAINIVYADSDFTDETTIVTSLADNKYLIECYVNSASDSTGDGDKKAAVKLARIMGMIRAILMNSRYLYLDFSEKFIQTRRIKSITRTQPRIASDALNTISGTIEAHYLAEEVTELETGTLEGYLNTVVKLSDTEKGYKYVIENT